MPFASIFTNNPLFAWGAVVLIALGVIRGKEELDEARGRRQQQRRSEARARKVQVKISEKNNEKSTQVADARASAPSGTVAADELPDDIRSILIRD